MKRYSVTYQHTGVEIGQYWAASDLEALDRASIDAGYWSYKDALDRSRGDVFTLREETDGTARSI